MTPTKRYVDSRNSSRVLSKSTKGNHFLVVSKVCSVVHLLATAVLSYEAVGLLNKVAESFFLCSLYF